MEDELAIDTDRRLQLLAPSGDACCTFGQQLLHQLAKRLRKGGLGNVALVLIELAGNEVATLRDDRLMQGVDQRRLADARVAENGRERRPAGGRHEFEDTEEHI